jgi:hypothetical protein
MRMPVLEEWVGRAAEHPIIKRMRALKIAPRERLLLAMLVLVLATYGVTVSIDFASAAGARAQEARISLAAATDTRQKIREQITAKYVSDERRRLKTWAFRDTNVWIARVKAQTAIEQIAGAGIQNLKVIPDAEPTGAGELQTLAFTIEGVFDWTTFIPLAEQIAQADAALFVTSVGVEGPPLRFRLVVQTLVGTEDP